MPAATPEPRRAASREEIASLLQFCKAGRLFDVQEWIAEGKPVNPPLQDKGRVRSPLDLAIKMGFHSLVQVLLAAGAVQDTDWWHAPMREVLFARRLDMIELLVQHGFDPKSISMAEVFRTWDPKIMEFFISRGASLVDGQPLAVAFIDRIRTALKIYKQYRPHMPELQEQLDIALRHHCKEGDMKWVSLMLWAGADPYVPGSIEPKASREDYDGYSALEWAALYNRWAVFSLRPIRSRPIPVETGRELLRHLSSKEGLPLLKHLLESGLNPNDTEDGSCSAYESYFSFLKFQAKSRYFHFSLSLSDRGADNEASRATLHAVHLLARHGGLWRPADKRDFNTIRQTLLELTADHTAEFVWIMAKFKAAKSEDLQTLLATPKMKAHTAKQWEHMRAMIDRSAGQGSTAPDAT